MIAYATPAAPPPVTRERTRNIALWMIQVVLAAQFALAGARRLPGSYRELADGLNSLAADLWLRYSGGTLEPAGAIDLVVPGLFAAAALCLVAVVVVASLIHLVGLLAVAHGPLARRRCVGHD